MKKALIAIGFILAGMVLAVLILPAFGIGFSWLIPSRLDTEIYTISQPFTELDVKADGCDVFLYRSSDDQAEVYMSEDKRTDCRVEVENGVLIVRWERQSAWTDKFRSHENPSLSVYLPGRSGDTLRIEGTSGHVYASGRFSPEMLTITTESGDVSVWDLQGGEAVFKSASGDISFSDSEAAAVSVDSSSGAIWMSDVELESLQAFNASGEISLDDVQASGEVKLYTQSGSIYMLDCDGGSFDICSVSGNVSGNLLSPKQFEASSVSGHVSVPQSDSSAGLCKILTSSGGVHIEVD